jgi:peptide/nickel transport system substrate-binding protein
MKRFVSLTIGSALALGTLFLLLGWMQTGRVSTLAEAAAPVSLAESVVKELVIGLGGEPGSLFLYDGDYYGQQVLDAIQDGPIDTPAYEPQPVILTKLPDVLDGDVAVQVTTVFSGDRIIPDVVGSWITYTGPPTTMQQLVVTFTLRDDVRWCDGHPLTAQDSVFSFDVQRSLPYSVTDLSRVERTFTYTQQSTFSVRWVRLPGSIGDGDWPYAANFDYFWTPLPYHVLSSTAPISIPTSWYARAPLGWGPFCFTEWVTDSITLDRNPFYWQAGLPKLDRLILRWDTAGDALLDDVVAGRVQAALVSAELDGNQVQALDAAGAIQGHLVPGPVWEHIDFNLDPIDAPTHTLPFTDVLVRRAIAYGADRQRIIDEVRYGVGAPPNAYVPDDHPAYPTATAMTYPYSPTLANTLLDAAGWVMSDGVRYKDGRPLAFVYRTTDTSVRRQIGAIFQENMAAIGVSVTLEFWNPSEFFADGPDGPVFGRWFDTAEYAWIFSGVPQPGGGIYLCANIPDPGNGWVGRQNSTGYCNPAYDNAVRAALATLTRTEALAYWQAAIAVWTQDLPALPLHYRVNVAAGVPDLTGLELDPTESDLWNVELWDIVAAGTVTEGGGELVSNSGGTTVTFPAGAVAGTTIVTLTPQVAPTDPPPGLGVTSHFFELQAVDAATGQPITGFSEPVSVTVRYNDAEVADLFEHTLAPYRWTGSEWEQIGEQTGESYTLDIESDSLTMRLWRFSRFGHFGTAIQSRLFLPLALKSQ